MKADVTDKLMKLIPRLASDHDGEIVATVRAIARVLKADGLDFHDLAAELRVPSTASVSGTHGAPFSHAYAPYRPPPPSAGLYTRDGFLRPWKEVIADILRRHRAIPARFGGGFLLQHQIDMLNRMRLGTLAPHAHERWLKTVDDRLRTAFEAQEADRKRRAA